MYKGIVLFFLFLNVTFGVFAQENGSDTAKVEKPADLPVISYSLTPKKYKIADIKVTGVKNYDDFVLIGFSGLSVGDEISVPGDEVTAAVKAFWKHGLFSDVKILANKIEGDSIWLEYQLKQRPRISEVNYHGIKKGEREDLEAKLGLKKGFQITPNVLDRAKILIEKFFDGKGFKNVDVNIQQKDDMAHEGEVILDIYIDKNEKTKIHRIYFEGNNALTARQLKKAMKKTNEKFSLFNDWKSSILEMFSTKKFTTEEYENDKNNLIAKYNEHGYRDAVLLADSVVNFNEKKVDIFLKVDEGEKYYLKDIRFVGNTKYSTDYLMAVLGMKPGEVYNQKKLNDRLSMDEDAVSNIYFNNGYLFFNADPVEVEVENDSIALEIRIQEGPQATINRVIINGNDRLYEDIVRRELRTKPGKLFSREDLMRSVRWNIIDDRMAEYAVSRDGYAISSVPVHLQTEKMLCQAAADTYNSALQLKSIRYDLKTEKAYLAGMDKNVPESFLNIPPDKRSAGICLQAEKWYPELLKKQPELIPDIVRNSCNVYSLNHKMEQCTGTKFSVGQIKKLYDGKALPVKEIWTPKGVMKDVAVSFDKRLKEFNFSPVRQIKRKGIKL